MLKKNTFILLVLVLSFTFVYSQEGKENKKERKVKFAGIPFAGYNRTIEFYFGALLTAYYKINKEDTISPSSSTGLAGAYTSNNSYFGGLIQQFYLKEDRWRIKFIGGLGNANLQVYHEFQQSGKFIDYQTKVIFMMLDVKRQVLNNFYAGLSATLADAETTFDYINPVTGEKPVDRNSLNNIGINFLYDSRNFVNFPDKGFQVSIKNQFYREWMNNDSVFTKIELSYDHYFSLLNDKRIIMFRFFSVMSFGAVPFQGQNVVQGDDIRGYSQGKYRDNQVFSIQTEYRHCLPRRFGFVLFVGVAAAVPDINGLLNTTYLPGGGAGIRYMILKDEKINIGIDIGVGKDDWSLTFRVGDAFSR